MLVVPDKINGFGVLRRLTVECACFWRNIRAKEEVGVLDQCFKEGDNPIVKWSKIEPVLKFGLGIMDELHKWDADSLRIQAQDSEFREGGDIVEGLENVLLHVIHPPASFLSVANIFQKFQVKLKVMMISVAAFP